MFPVVAVIVTVVTESPTGVDDPDVNQSVNPIAAAIKTTTTPMIGQRYRLHSDGGSTAKTFSSSSGNSAVRSTVLSGASVDSVLTMSPVQTSDFSVSRIQL